MGNYSVTLYEAPKGAPVPDLVFEETLLFPGHMDSTPILFRT